MAEFNPDFTRAELIQVLATMRITIPPSSKLSDDALERRLKQAVNAAQMLSSVILRPSLDPSQYPKWPLRGTRSVFDAIRRGDMNEALTSTQARMRGMSNAVPLYSNAFMDMRQTLMSLAKSWDEGLDLAIMQDLHKEKCAVNIRIVDVLEINESTPLLLVLYKSVTSANPLPGLRWIEELRAKRVDFLLPNVSSTELEQKIILKTLGLNAKLLPADYTPERMESEKEYNVSFLLPMGPLSFEDLGKLSLDTGCAVCGKKVASRCSQCQSISYCGTECQRRDWPNHKETCRSLKGGTWHTIPMSSGMPGTQQMVTFPMDRFDPTHKDRYRITDSTKPPENAHGDKIFLIKLQIGLDNINMLIYDRQRTFQALFLKQTDPVTFAKFKEEMQGPRKGYLGRKMYRWAKRISDWELSVCLDREPQEEIKW